MTRLKTSKKRKDVLSCQLAPIGGLMSSPAVAHSTPVRARTGNRALRKARPEPGRSDKSTAPEIETRPMPGPTTGQGSIETSTGLLRRAERVRPDYRMDPRLGFAYLHYLSQSRYENGLPQPSISRQWFLCARLT